ncbi:MAG: hypothetical protein LIP09_03920 [Bacteroidales bacterium]|nr:hypothetical protein [Bacteroidales bacterium]
MKIEDYNDADYIDRDLGGYPFNKVYPPNPSRFGSHHGGYQTNTQQVFSTTMLCRDME